MKYLSFSITNNTINYKYEINKYRFEHQVVFENLTGSIHPELAFQLGLAELLSYWKLTSDPLIEVEAGYLPTSQIYFWKKLLLQGMGQYFYENKIDFTQENFVNFKVSANGMDKDVPINDPSLQVRSEIDTILVPVGGGKDSIVTMELLKNKYKVQPIIVHPSSPASKRLVKNPIEVRRIFDSQLFELNKQPGMLNGHVPYSAILAFISLIAANSEKIPFIIVSNERSSNEGNVEYLGHQINHQYSKSLEFESDFNTYIKDLGSNISYFSFLRPLYELQIAKIFSHYPQYFDKFRSCNKNQQQDSWCGVCPKCLSISMTLRPWTSTETIEHIFGFDPITLPSNQQLLTELTDPTKTKPFECVTTFEEANICLEFIAYGQTHHIKEFLSRWGSSPNTPTEFINILKNAYNS